MNRREKRALNPDIQKRAEYFNSNNIYKFSYDKLSESIKCFSLPSDFVNEIKDILNTDDYQFLKNYHTNSLKN